MKFKYYTTQDMKNENDIEFNTLEEFIEWCKQNSDQNFNPHEVIVDPVNMTLEIYNGYRE